MILPERAHGPDGIALAPARLAGSEWVAVIERVPNAVFMASAASDPEHIAAGRTDRRAVRGRTGRVHCEDADPADHSIDRGGRGRRPRRPAAIPVDAGGETGVLARAFARVIG